MRILVADDEASILAAYKICLEKDRDRASDALNAMGNALFDEPIQKEALIETVGWTDVDYASQGEDVVAAVKAAVEAGQPYVVLFLDMRMPPGMDGRDTARLVRQIDANINIVVVTGYSDHSPLEVARVAGPQDKLYYLAKPFETDEIRTMAASLSAKWRMEQDLKEAHAEIQRKFKELESAQVEIVASEARCRHIALHDQLTRLPNRVYFQNFLNEALSDRQRDVAVLFVDLDRFKLVNDTLGHGAGDQLVCDLSQRLSTALPEGSMIARLGGDEFGIVLTGNDVPQVSTIANALVKLCAQPFSILGSEARVGASIGYTTRGASNCNGSELLRRADLALYAAKESGRNCAYSFDAKLDESARQRSEIDARLRHAIDNDLLELAYQPIVDPVDNDPVGYEALLRWNDPEMGAVSPKIFVPIAEETGLILQLGEWVINKAIAECANWPCGVVSINLSTRHFQSSTMIDYICQKATEYNLPHERIQLEITETALFDDTKLAADILVELRNRGIRIALDDFGTGYSSLVNLKDFEIDCIKIDQSFIAKLGSDRQSSAIVHAVTSLARTWGLKVVAEGVESAMQVQALRLVGCELMQGYFYCAPMCVDDLPYRQDDEAQIAAGDASQAA